mgnify:CR=1 FL=1
MARLIVKSPYIKCGAGQSAGGYLKYIATQERVEIIPDDRPPTQKQTQLNAKLVKDFPDAKELMEYEDYVSHPTKATASALITLALESNWDRVQGTEGYAKYIALRPRAERLGNTVSSEMTMPLTSPLSRTNWITTPAACGRTSSPSTGRTQSGLGMIPRTPGAPCSAPTATTSPQR